MPTTPLTQCHQCKKTIDAATSPNPWTFQRWEMSNVTDKTGLVTIMPALQPVVRFCHINCIAAYYKLAPWESLAPINGEHRAPRS